VDPRSPTSREKQLLKLLLPVGGFPDAENYRAQIEHLTVTDRCPCGCPTVSFTVDTSVVAPASFHGNPLLPIEALAGEGEDLLHLILFARDGLLESLELVYYSKEPPPDFPDPPALRVVNRLEQAH
jgi:hypothetical protein